MVHLSKVQGLGSSEYRRRYMDASGLDSGAMQRVEEPSTKTAAPAGLVALPDSPIAVPAVGSATPATGLKKRVPMKWKLRLKAAKLTEPAPEEEGPLAWYEAKVECGVCGEQVARSTFYSSHIRTHGLRGPKEYTALHPVLPRIKKTTATAWECLACPGSGRRALTWSKASIKAHLSKVHGLKTGEYEQRFMGATEDMVVLAGEPVEGSAHHLPDDEFLGMARRWGALGEKARAPFLARAGQL
jgi:hypothetical protein